MIHPGEDDEVEIVKSAPKKRLGDILVGHRLISSAQLDQALEVQRDSGQPLGSILINLGYISEELLLKALASQMGVTAWHLEKDPAQMNAASMVSPEICRKYQVLPVQLRGDLLILAMRNPHDLDAADYVRNITKLRVEPVLANEGRLSNAIDALFQPATDVKALDQYVNEALRETRAKSAARQQDAHLAEVDTRPVVGLVNQLLTDAIRMGASDVHLEPRKEKVEVRYRVDGQLVKVRDIPLDLHPMVTTRLKIMAELDIVEFRLPQDGRMSVQADHRSVDIRMSVLPNYRGQRLVLRILDKSVSLKKLSELGFNDDNLSLFQSLIAKPYGIFLVTGPTGSGKTTTLYAALNEVKHVSTNIMTCEDPVEYEIDGISQSQVHEKVGLTFAAQLRATLRQDPDTILVGEIRDLETAETAIRAAMTGHLVLSTLHTNDAPSAIPRLLDIGIDPMLLGSSIIGVMAQRLVRKLCPDCKKEAPEDWIDISSYLPNIPEVTIYKPAGCPKCMGSGYRGRFAIHEVMPVTHEIAKAVGQRAATEVLRDLASQVGYAPMQMDVLQRVLTGDTSLHEAKRVVYFENLQGVSTPNALRLAA